MTIKKISTQYIRHGDKTCKSPCTRQKDCWDCLHSKIKGLTHYRWKDTCRLKVKGWKRPIMQMETMTTTKAGVAILLSDTIDFKTKAICNEIKKDISE